ncbi:MAG: glutathione S-transferase family protein [Rhodospirillales bacterium]
MILSWTKLASYSAKLRIACALKGLAPELRLPPGGSYRSDAYRQIVPLGTVPALVDGDMVLSESDAIAEYLEERFPEPALLPGTARERARTRFLSRFHDLHLEPPLRALFGQAAPSTRDPAIVAARADAFARLLSVLETQLDERGPFAAGPGPTLADCGFPPTLAIADGLLAMLGRPPVYGPRTRRWREAVATDARIESVMAPYRAEVSAWLAAKAGA